MKSWEQQRCGEEERTGRKRMAQRGWGAPSPAPLEDNDKIFAEDGVPDQIKCGDGNDAYNADSVDSVSDDCEYVYSP